MSNPDEWVRKAFKALKEGNVHSALEGLQHYVDSSPPADPIEDAKRVLEKDYRDDVDSVVKELLDAWRTGEFDGARDSFEQRLEETVGGTQRVIYTFRAQLCLAFSSSDDAYLEMTGDDSIPAKNGIEWSTLAHYAMRQDVLDGLEHEGIDANEDPPLKGSSLCAGCEHYKPCKDGLCDDCTQPTEETGEEAS